MKASQSSAGGGAGGLEVQEPPVLAVEGQKVDDPPADGARLRLVFQEPLAGRPGDIRGQEGGKEGVRLAGREFGLNFRRQGRGHRPRQALLPEGGGQGDRIRAPGYPGPGFAGPGA